MVFYNPEEHFTAMKLFHIIDNRAIRGSSYWVANKIKSIMAESAVDALIADGYRQALGNRMALEWFATDAGLNIETTRYIEALTSEEWDEKENKNDNN